ADAARAALGQVMDASSTAGHTAAVAQAGKAYEQILQMLLETERFVTTGDVARLDAINAHGGEAKAALSGLSGILGMFRPELAAQADAAAASVDPYLAEAGKLAALTGERDELRAELDLIGPQMQQALQGLNTAVVAHQNELGEASQSQAGVTLTMLLAAAGVAVLLGLVMAVTMGRWLSGAIQRMASSMRQLADGDLEVELAAADNRSELGQMAQAQIGRAHV